MKWTTPPDLKAQVLRLWERGLLLTSLAGGEEIIPRRLTLKGPDSRALSDNFSEVRDWVTQLSGAAGHYRIVWRRFNHRVLGNNEIPSEIWVDTLENALRMIGKGRAAEEFANLVSLTSEQEPKLIPWLAHRPLHALELAGEWPRLLAVVDWMLKHPRPAIYLRQIDLPGVHTKLIEGRRGVLKELLDLVLPPESIDETSTGVGGFCRRYGFREKPPRVRFRILDPETKMIPGVGAQDITLTRADFSRWQPPVSRVFITENEINFLAFPDVPDAMVIFGAGYGFDNLADAFWLKGMEMHYWGDIDTHGLAILNQLRGFFPEAASFLMDQQTLLAHRPLWGVEQKPEAGNLDRLNEEESALYDQLRRNRWGERIRLEQERIGFDFLVEALRGI
jgi:hypothetical protein